MDLRQYILAMGMLLLGSNLSLAQHSEVVKVHAAADDACEEIIYTVKQGDMLHKIASSYGSYRFWEVIYIANADQMTDPNLIYPGQSLIIPQNVAAYTESGKDLQAVLSNPFCETSNISIEKVNESLIRSKVVTALISRLEITKEKAPSEEEIEAKRKEKLAKLRELFEKVVKEEKEEKVTQKEKEKELLNLMDGMVYDETRSKIGRDFYDIFYRNWDAPADASNYSIKVVETPGPSLGTVVSVIINNNEIFKTRLQPRYETIEDAGKYAVRVSYSYLARNQNQQAQIF